MSKVHHRCKVLALFIYLFIYMCCDLNCTLFHINSVQFKLMYSSMHYKVKHKSYFISNGISHFGCSNRELSPS